MYSEIDSVYKHAIMNSGVVGTIDSVSATFLIKESSDGSDNHYDLKTLISSKLFNQGSLVQSRGNTYMVIDVEEQFNQSVYYKGTIRKAHEIVIGGVKMYSVVDCIKIQQTNTKLVTFVDDLYGLIISDQYRVKLDDIITYKNVNFKIQSIDNSKDNVLSLTAKFYTVAHGYYISLVETSKDLYLGDSGQIVATCRCDYQDVKNPYIIYSSSDDNVATVDGSGLVVCHMKGSCVITCQYEDVKATLALKVMEKAQDVAKEFKVVGAEGLVYNKTATYICQNKDGSDLGARTFKFSIDDSSLKLGIASIESQDGKTCTIKAIIKDSVFTLIATDNSDVKQKAELSVMTTRR